MLLCLLILKWLACDRYENEVIQALGRRTKYRSLMYKIQVLRSFQSEPLNEARLFCPGMPPHDLLAKKANFFRNQVIRESPPRIRLVFPSLVYVRPLS